ncbi:hypothetical protein JTE90_007968 [Oedothorax gibbosus]|uniref:Uncharacterized protein n=1 Tax=Oedothorax gibbosus TaxID=931172 RepID=A0AAV6TNR9_9ARAC|nr:hypothetical protein JTE90_007968 [Oedothorax gibbosus]
MPLPSSGSRKTSSLASLPASTVNPTTRSTTKPPRFISRMNDISEPLPKPSKEIWTLNVSSISSPTTFPVLLHPPMAFPSHLAAKPVPISSEPIKGVNLTTSLHPLPNSNQQPIDAHLQPLPSSPEPPLNDHPNLAIPTTTYDSNAMETQEWTQPRNALKRKIQETPVSNTFSHPTKYSTQMRNSLPSSNAG